MKLNKILYTLCCLSMTAVPVLGQHKDSTIVKNKHFNAKDYLLQNRYVPAGRPINKDAKGNNLSFGFFGGISKLQGAASSREMTGEIGISAMKDMNSFHSFRAALLYGKNSTLNKFGLEVDHIFRISDYIAGWKPDRNIYLETVIGFGGYATKPKQDKAEFAFGVHGGLILTKRLSDNFDFYIEPRLNLYTDGIDAYSIPRKYDITFQALAGLRYRLDGYKYYHKATTGFLDNYFYEVFAGVSGDFNDRVWSHTKMKTLGPTAGLAVGKWYYPFGIKGSLFGGFRYTTNATKTDISEEPYAGIRLEGMISLNSFITPNITDPKLEVNVTGGYELGILAHKGSGIYNNKIRPFSGPTASIQSVYFVRPELGIFAQARWSGGKYTQNFYKGADEKRRMTNLGLEFGVQYRRRNEQIEARKGKYKFEPYNMVSVQLGTNFPLHTQGVNKNILLNELGQQFALSYTRRYSPIAAVRGTLEAARYGYNKDDGTYPLTISGDFMLDALAIAGGYNPERIVSVLPFVGILFTHNETADKNNFGVHGGADLVFKTSDKWSVFLQGALRAYKGQITPSARVYTSAKFSFVPNASVGMAYKF